MFFDDFADYLYCFVAKLEELCDCLFFFIGIIPLIMCQDFDTCLVGQGTQMIVWILEQKGFSRTVSFSLVLLWLHSVGGFETSKV